jgi:hypothetical protein
MDGLGAANLVHGCRGPQRRLPSGLSRARTLVVTFKNKAMPHVDKFASHFISGKLLVSGVTKANSLRSQRADNERSTFANPLNVLCV